MKQRLEIAANPHSGYDLGRFESSIKSLLTVTPPENYGRRIVMDARQPHTRATLRGQVPFGRGARTIDATQHQRPVTIAISLVITIMLAVTTLVAAQTKECTAGKLSDYEQLGAQGCTIGDKHFSNFTYHRPPNGLSADAIVITPGTVPDSDDPALLFEGAWVSPSLGSSISYDVEVAPSGKPINSASLEMQFGEITGTGEARVAAELHQSTNIPSNCGPTELSLTVFVGASPHKQAIDNGRLKDPARQLCVVTPMSITPGKNGSASLNGYMTVFHSSQAQSSSVGSHLIAAASGSGSVPVGHYTHKREEQIR
jgi:hypothetical protein